MDDIKDLLEKFERYFMEHYRLVGNKEIITGRRKVIVLPKERKPEMNSKFRKLCNKLYVYTNENIDQFGFKDLLITHRLAANISDAELYKTAHLTRQAYNRIFTEEKYHPSKDTVVALGLALRLGISDFQELLNSAGYTLSRSIISDLIIRFCISEKIYNIFDVNALLSIKHQRPLGHRNLK